MTVAMTRPLIYGQEGGPDTITPSGYVIAFDAASYTLGTDADDVDVDVTGAEDGVNYSLTVVSSGGGDPVTDAGEVESVEGAFSIEGLDLSGLTAGTLTATLILTDAVGQAGAPATDTATLNPAA